MKLWIIFIQVIMASIVPLSRGVVSWGDQGNGKYINPVLNADYSDPDIIRVGDKFFMVCSDFHYIGMPVLESSDLVNWQIISHVYDKFDYPGWDDFKRYGGGSWAPSIRYHNGLFYVYFCTPNEGLFMATTDNPHGEWSELHLVKAVEKWEDPCPFWDEDGNAYLVRSQFGAGPIYLHKMSLDGKRLLDDGIIIYEGEVAEGPKMHKFNGKYYISLPEGGVWGGWQTALRSNSIYGPYERKIVLETGTTNINGPHQGAIVDTPDGKWWFLHFQMVQTRGRVVHLQPMQWIDGWPRIGIDYNNNGVGEPVKEWEKPIKGNAVFKPQASDSFDSGKLGLQWQANHKFVPENIFFNKKKGWLSIVPIKADSLRNACNTLVQKFMGYTGNATVKLNVSELSDGQSAGLACLSHIYRSIGITRSNQTNLLYVEYGGKRYKFQSILQDEIYLRADFNSNTNKHTLSYSLDGKNFITIGHKFEMNFADWKGARIGIYSYTTKTNEVVGILLSS